MFHCTLYLKNFRPPSLPHVSAHSPLGILFGHKYKWFGLVWCFHHKILLNFLAKSVHVKKTFKFVFFLQQFLIYLRYLKCFSRPRLYDKPEEKENRGICVKQPQNSCKNKLFDKLTQTVRNFQKHACRQHLKWRWIFQKTDLLMVAKLVGKGIKGLTWLAGTQPN